MKQISENNCLFFQTVRYSGFWAENEKSYIKLGLKYFALFYPWFYVKVQIGVKIKISLNFITDATCCIFKTGPSSQTLVERQ